MAKKYKHVMTPARRAALKKAQLASAAKRKRATNVRMASQARRRRRSVRWERRAVKTAGAVISAYAAYKYLTPQHRKLVDEAAATTGKKIKSKVRHGS